MYIQCYHNLNISLTEILIFSRKKNPHVVEKIEINTAIVTQT